MMPHPSSSLEQVTAACSPGAVLRRRKPRRLALPSSSPVPGNLDAPPRKAVAPRKKLAKRSLPRHRREEVRRGTLPTSSTHHPHLAKPQHLNNLFSAPTRLDAAYGILTRTRNSGPLSRRVLFAGENLVDSPCQGSRLQPETSTPRRERLSPRGKSSTNGRYLATGEKRYVEVCSRPCRLTTPTSPNHNTSITSFPADTAGCRIRDPHSNKLLRPALPALVLRRRKPGRLALPR
ncbi:hypothetical protein ALCH109712_16425 [Alkalicoccus chagannorensis]